MIESIIKQYDYENNEIEVLKVTYTDGTESLVPKNPENRHYQEVLDWLDDGNTITD